MGQAKRSGGDQGVAARRARSVLLALGALALTMLGIGLGVGLGRPGSADRALTAGVAKPTNPEAGPSPVSPMLEKLRSQVETKDVSTRTLLAFSHLALEEGQLPAAMWGYRRVLRREPRHVEALTHLGIILFRGNHIDEGLARIDEALAIDPRYAHAHWDRAQILFHGKKDYAEAARALEAFLALVPTGKDVATARTLLEEARRRAAGEAAGRRG